MLKKILAGNPQLNVIYGATSVGKTALLRQVLASDDFFVITFDLRISGFGDLRSLYIALCQQFRRVFEEVRCICPWSGPRALPVVKLPADLCAQMHDEEMDKLAITFKHLVIDVENQEPEQPPVEITVAHLADLMETLQSCLLKYWEYDPEAKLAKEEEEKAGTTNEDDSKPARRVANLSKEEEKAETPLPAKSITNATSKDLSDKTAEEGDDGKKVFQKRPIVFLLDEAHKLPALINDQLSLKVFLDALLVLTKQDRLCHAILSTSDSFFQHFLRAMNVGHHAQLLTIGDCSRQEAHAFFRDEILPTIPDKLQNEIDFDIVYGAFGGKLSHISDYVAAWVNKNGQDLPPLRSAIFTQAYTLLQFHMTNESFTTYSPLSTATAWAGDADSGSSIGNGSQNEDRFSREDLIFVMRKLIKPPYSLPYFALCRMIGTGQADAMIKTRILDLRWTRTVTPEQDGVEEVWSDDGIERPIVLPMTRIVRRAMEVVLQEVDREVKEKGQTGEKRGTQSQMALGKE